MKKIYFNEPESVIVTIASGNIATDEPITASSLPIKGNNTPFEMNGVNPFGSTGSFTPGSINYTPGKYDPNVPVFTPDSNE